VPTRHRHVYHLSTISRLLKRSSRFMDCIQHDSLKRYAVGRNHCGLQATLIDRLFQAKICFKSRISTEPRSTTRACSVSTVPQLRFVLRALMAVFDSSPHVPHTSSVSLMRLPGEYLSIERGEDVNQNVSSSSASASPVKMVAVRAPVHTREGDKSAMTRRTHRDLRSRYRPGSEGLFSVFDRV
jgi:hypothetical protein